MATVSVGQKISASQYNDLQSRVSQILGPGTYVSSVTDIESNSGYGQTLASSQVSLGTVILASHMESLYTDINKCSNHQIGVDANVETINTGDLIAADASDTKNLAGYNDYDAAITTITDNKFSIDAQNATSGTFNANSVRATAWNGTIKHIVTVSFSTFEQRRYFFNAGGEIRFNLTLTGGSGSKTEDWRTMLTNMGTVSLNYITTTTSGTGTTANIGNYSLTTGNQIIFSKGGGAAVYAENQIVIYAKHDSSTGTVLTFEIQLQDNDTGDRPPNPPTPPYGPVVDENVTGTLTSFIQYYQPSGSNVEVLLPSVTTTNSL